MAKAKAKSSKSKLQVTRRPGRPKAEDRIPKALTQEQLTVLKVMGITPADLGLGSVPTLDGPVPASLDGKPLSELAEWLGKFEAMAAANKDGQAGEYRERAGKVRWLIWKRKYAL